MNVTPRKWYVVTTDSECVVTDANGKVLCTATAGEQKLFYATTPVVTLSDETATVGEANFKRAALALGMLGGGEPAWLTALKRELAFILDGARVQYTYSSTKKHLLILTDLSDDSLNDSVLEVCARFAPQGTTYEVFNLNKYAECKTVEDMVAVNPDYKNDLTEDREWLYALTKLTSAPSEAKIFGNSPIKKINIAFPALTKASHMFDGSKLEEARLSFPILTTDTWGLCENSKLKSVYIDAPKLTVMNGMFAAVGTLNELSDANFNVGAVTEIAHFASNSSLKRVNVSFQHVTTAFYAFFGAGLVEFGSELPKLSDGSLMFAYCSLNKESAMRILNSIPVHKSGSHKLALGVHVDHQNDEEVLAAIALADIAQTPIEEGGKGWTLTVQWNGTPTAQTASTFGLRKPPIYAKLDTSERPDGTVENFLNWGHYVTNREENGYMEFASLEEAREHFNITE